jgi:hypothetical protein
VAAAGLAAFLALVDGRSVLAWSFGLPAAAARVPLPGVGVLLGGALLLALAGALLPLAERLAGTTSGAAPAARAASWGATSLGTAGLVLAAARIATSGSAVAWIPLLGLAAGVSVLAAALAATRPSASVGLARRAAGALPAAAWLALAGAIAVAVASVWRHGTYATGASSAAAAASLLGLAALEPTAAAGLRRFAFLLALLTLSIA